MIDQFTNLPEYARSIDARRLLGSIVTDPPPSRPVRDDWGVRDTPTYRSYHRPDVSALKQLWKHWREREFSKLDRQFAITNVWDDARSREVLGAETPDELIHRLLTVERLSEKREAA